MNTKDFTETYYIYRRGSHSRKWDGAITVYFLKTGSPTLQMSLQALCGVLGLSQNQMMPLPF